MLYLELDCIEGATYSDLAQELREIANRIDEGYKGGFPRFTSITYFRYTTTDSMSVDDYRSDDERRQKRGEKSLIRQARVWGDKHIMRYE